MDDQHLTAQLLRFFEFQQPLGQFLFVITFNVRVRVVAQPDEKASGRFRAAAYLASRIAGPHR